MDPHRLYIEQTTFNGISYTHSQVRDTYSTWNIVCSKSPFKYGDAKDAVTRNWLDEHGEDVYIPADVKLKKFDVEFTFLCNGTEEDVKYNTRQFHRFLLGKSWKRKTGNSESTVDAHGARLVIYDAYNSLGWKDVRFKSFSADGLVMDNTDDEVVLEFKVIFEVCDPYSEVYVQESGQTGSIILAWRTD